MLVVVPSSPALASAEGILRGIGVEERLEDPPRLALVLGVTEGLPERMPIFVHLAVDRPALEPSPGQFELKALLDRVSLYNRLGVRLVLNLGALPLDTTTVDGWGAFVHAVASRCEGRVQAYQFSLADGEALPQAAFVLKRAAIEVRASDPTARVVLDGLSGLSAEVRKAFFAEGVAPYVDAIAADFQPSGDPGSASRSDGLSAFLEVEHPGATILVRGVPLADDPPAAVREFLRWEFGHLGSEQTLTTYRVGALGLAAVLRTAGTLDDALFGEVVPLDPGAADVMLSSLSAEVADSSVRHRLLYNTRHFATYLAYWADGAPAGARMRVGLKEPGGRSPMVRDGLTGKVAAASDFSWDSGTSHLSAVVPLSATPLLLDFNYASEEVKATRVDVTERTMPRVGEIIFRHQQVQAAQDAVLHSYVANVRMEQHFRPSATDSGFDVVTDNLLFHDREGTEWEELSFSINGTKWGADRPPIPLLQPEKVLSLPLDLRLNADYSYRLDGTAVLSGRECYVIQFSPLDSAKPLYRGTVWIDSTSYDKVKLQVVQTRPGAPVLSNEEVHSFAVAGATGGRSVHLLKSLSSKQIILIAGRNLLVEREVRFEGYRLDPADFDERRATSRKGGSVMYRDTADGLRYFVKKGDQRVVAEKPTSSARGLAVGTVIDPSYDFPLPVIGINYLDFDFIGKNSQLAVLFGGILALVNVQRPQLIGPHVDGSIDLFAIGVSANDKVFDAAGEIAGEQIKTRPFSTGANLGYQFTPFQKLTASYQFRYDAYKAASGTAPGFVLPTSTATNGLGLAYEYRRWGYTLQGSGSVSRRSAWSPWGVEPAQDASGERQYVKYGGSLSKDFYAGLQKFHINLSYFGGRHLDRFSMYQFGLFDETRIHGVPTAGVRFPELAMVRGTYSLDVLSLYRLDVFVDQALGRDPSGEHAWQPITGLGVGFNLRGPFRTFVRGEVGKSFLPQEYSGAGSYNAQITFLRPI